MSSPDAYDGCAEEDPEGLFQHAVGIQSSATAVHGAVQERLLLRSCRCDPVRTEGAVLPSGQPDGRKVGGVWHVLQSSGAEMAASPSAERRDVCGCWREYGVLLPLCCAERSPRHRHRAEPGPVRAAGHQYEAKRDAGRSLACRGGRSGGLWSARA